ncbi:TonB-dependent receptor [Pseudomaricurvus alcaniphilus]|uniref:TonB-dependent receptor n=1 Tax=Pseudomaricurvus alcaniphilus TaxID=1166482 RepID=UPI00140CD580|nr:TonB-dependent receptor [Pseudomaricurvus alcaniphilus]NHN39895.1 TonB-dependent receptor [Pseudomaricurvus alcaniphilus]
MLKTYIGLQKTLTLSTLGLAISCGSTAFAQSTDSSPSSSPSTSSNRVIEEITVTANRRQESLQESSLVISVLSQKEMQAVKEIWDLTSAEPSVQIGKAGNIAQAYIRGVGSFVATARQENAVAFNVDGVYLQTGAMVSPAMFDIERVEILKGPQGTLYGRNATGGAINFISRAPKLDEFSGYVSTDLGNYDLRRFTGAVNVPLSDTTALRVALQKSDRDGYFTDGTDDEDSLSGRVRFLWEASEDITLNLTAEYADFDGAGAGSALLQTIDNDPWIGALDPRRVTYTTAPAPLKDPFYDYDSHAFTTQLDWELDFATLTILPAYRHEHYTSRTYVPGYRFTEEAKTTQSSLEVRLGDQTENLKWVVGAFGLQAEQELNYGPENAGILQGVNIIIPEQTTDSYAIFGEATYSLTDKLRVIAGLRYSKEETEGGGINNSFNYRGYTPAFDPSAETGDFSFSDKTSANSVTYRTGIEYDISEDSMLFVTYSKGFKGGGWYPDRPTEDPTFEPETLEAFEVGMRNQFLDNSLQLNVEAFFWQYKDQQQAYAGLTSIGVPALLTVNATDSDIYGGSMDATWRFTDNDTLHATIEYLHAEYGNFARNTPGPAYPGSQCSSALASTGGFMVDCSGARMQRTPKYSGSVSYEHVFPLSSGGTITAGADLTFATGRYLTIDLSPSTYDGSYVVTNADLTYSNAEDTWSLTTFVRNIGDTAFASGGIVNPANGLFNATINAPRTYGLRAQYNF